MRHRPPRKPSTTPAKPSPKVIPIPEKDEYDDEVEAFEGIVEPE
jgi:hypothetical protein